MSRRARLRSQHVRRSGHVAVNSVEIAINGARKLSQSDVDGQHQLLTNAAAEFARGVQCAAHWLSLADCANVAETFAAMGLGSGDEADTVIQRAQQALHDVHQRHETRGTWTLYADEIDALHWLVQLHRVQLQRVCQGDGADREPAAPGASGQCAGGVNCDRWADCAAGRKCRRRMSASLFTQLLIAERYGVRLSMEQLAEALGVSRGGLYNMISANNCPAPTYMDMGKRWADCRDVAAHLDECRSRVKAAA